MTKLIEILIVVFILGMLTGIIPLLALVLMNKYFILTILILVIDIVLIFYELCR